LCDELCPAGSEPDYVALSLFFPRRGCGRILVTLVPVGDGVIRWHRPVGVRALRRALCPTTRMPLFSCARPRRPLACIGELCAVRPVSSALATARLQWFSRPRT